jgi:hypothetical protein
VTHTVMAWRCPACGEQIRHSAAEEMPRPGFRYRCHICRLELKVDPQSRKLTTAELEEEPEESLEEKRRLRQNRDLRVR